MIHVFISIILGVTTLIVVIIHQLAAAPTTFYPDFAAFWDTTVLALKHPELAFGPATRTPAGPFGYPPTAFVAFTPFAFLPFPLAYLIWVLGSLSLYVYFATYLFNRFKTLGVALLILAPPVWTVILAGSTTLPMGALVLGALLLMPDRKLLAGFMFGIAAAIKPQTIVMVPVALLAIREWRVIASATATAIAISIIATIMFGLHIWFDWLGRLPEVLDYGSKNLNQISLWPESFRQSLTFRSFAILLLLGLLGCSIVWTTFLATNRPEHRLVAVVGGAWLISPYVNVYELAMIAPAVIAFVLEEIGSRNSMIERWRSYIGAFAVFTTPIAIVSVPVFLILNTLVILRQRSARKNVDIDKLGTPVIS